MLVSLHLPKSAGTSFRLSLQDIYGESLLADYEGMSMIQEYLCGSVSPEKLIDPPVGHILSSTRCIHGHFLPAKYLYLCGANSETRFITWLRDPFSRLVSHYLFFKRSYNPAAGPLFRRVIEEAWTVERFCLSEEYRNIYSKYLWNFPLHKFSFIGISEFYEQDMEYFSKVFLNRETQTHELNRGDRDKAEEILGDTELRTKVEAFHDEDVNIYKHALELRAKRVR